jgi:glucokinase
MILAGDIGATNSRLGLFAVKQGRLQRIASRRLLNRDYAGMDAVLAAFAGGAEEVTALCLGVAGPIVEGTAELTNLGWRIESAQLQRRFPGASIALLNDVEATGYGVGLLEPAQLLTLNPGLCQPTATAALIASGSGLGECILYRGNGSVTPLATEAGHADFAPNSELECEFLHHMRSRFGHVSLDRVLSGPGLRLIYDFLKCTGRAPEQPEIAAALAGPGGSQVISEAALAGSCELCRQALEMYIAIYGAEAGNLALRSLAVGGVFVAGGIAPQIRASLAVGNFMRAFVAKGRMEPLLRTVPVHVVLDDETALLGAAHHAATLLQC